MRRAHVVAVAHGRAYTDVMPDPFDDVPVSPKLEQVQLELENLRQAFAVLSDGQWDKRDPAAIVMILGSVAGLAALVLSSLQLVGIL